jgi:hypothetical protein
MGDSSNLRKVVFKILFDQIITLYSDYELG